MYFKPHYECHAETKRKRSFASGCRAYQAWGTEDLTSNKPSFEWSNHYGLSREGFFDVLHDLQSFFLHFFPKGPIYDRNVIHIRRGLAKDKKTFTKLKDTGSNT